MEEKIKILLLTANPKSTTQLSLGKEIREIDLALTKANYRDRFEFIPKSAVRVEDLFEELLSESPQIVHFSGHGGGDEGLVLEDDSAEKKFVSAESLARLFQSCSDTVKCVLLNACYSYVQADAIHAHIDHVIGMSQAIGDSAAIEFAKGFYTALGAGRSLQSAFEFGCTFLDLKSIPESHKPVIHCKTSDLSLVSDIDSKLDLQTLETPEELEFDKEEPSLGQSTSTTTINAQQSQGFINNASATVTQHFGNQTSINTGGGDYAGKDMYKSDRSPRPNPAVAINTVLNEIARHIEQAENQGEADLVDDLRSLETTLQAAIKADIESKTERRQMKLDDANRLLQKLSKHYPSLKQVLNLLLQVR